MRDHLPGSCTPLSLWFLALDTGRPTLGSKCTAQNPEGGMFYLSWMGGSGERETVSSPGGRAWLPDEGREGSVLPRSLGNPGLCDKVWRLRRGLKCLSALTEPLLGLAQEWCLGAGALLRGRTPLA